MIFWDMEPIRLLLRTENPIVLALRDSEMEASIPRARAGD
jgi:hypothetical protein